MKKEREISLVDLFWRILSGHRRVLVWIIICTLAGAAFSGYKYIKAKQSYSDSDKISAEREKARTDLYESLAESTKGAGAGLTYKESEYLKKQGFTDEDIIPLEDLMFVKKVLDDEREYMASSILMGVNPSNEPVYKFSFYLDCEEEDRDRLAAAYTEKLKNGELTLFLANNFYEGSELGLVEELIRVRTAKISEDSSISTLTGNYYNQGLQSDKVTVMVVEIVGKNEDVLQLLGRNFKQFINGLSDGISNEFCQHRIQILTDGVVYRVDDELLNRQQLLLDNINTNRNRYDSVKKSLTQEQLEAFELLCGARDYNSADSVNGEAAQSSSFTADSNTAEHTGAKFSLKYVLLGFIAGLFLGCLWIVVEAVFSTKLLVNDELENVYALRPLGILEKTGKENAVDRWLYRLKNKSSVELSNDERLELISSNIAIVLEKLNCNGVALLSATASVPEAVTKLASKLTAKGIKAIAAGNVCYDISALKKASELQTAVIITEKDVSAYKDIEAELTTLNGNQVEILGFVGIE